MNNYPSADIYTAPVARAPYFNGALPGTRTLGPLIKSQLLYQLS